MFTSVNLKHLKDLQEVQRTAGPDRQSKVCDLKNSGSCFLLLKEVLVVLKFCFGAEKNVWTHQHVCDVSLQAENSALTVENDNQRKQYERCLDEVRPPAPLPSGFCRKTGSCDGSTCSSVRVLKGTETLEGPKQQSPSSKVHYQRSRTEPDLV